MIRPFAGSAIMLSLIALQAQTAPQSAAPAPVASTSVGPKIQFANTVYDYGRQVSGTMVNYTFIFTNTGDQVLEVPSAQGSCHCTTAGDWSKRVEPGQTGTVPVTFNSTGFSGQLTRTVTITCNDKAQPAVVLQMTGTIWRPIEVNPAMAYFTIPPDSTSPVTNIVHIISNLEEPLGVFSPESNQRAFTAVLTTNEPGKKYDLNVVALPPFSQGSIQGQIAVKTTSATNPVISVPIMANVPAAVTIVPPIINLPFVPLEAPFTNIVTIRNVSVAPMTISEPAFSSKEVKVSVKEDQPGHQFSVNLAFPRGYQPPAGAPVEFSVKTSHPQFPLLHAPLNAIARPK